MLKIYSALVVAALAPVVAAAAAPKPATVPPRTLATNTKLPKLRPAPGPTGTHIGGAVLTNAGDPLPGATVFIKGTYVGTSTNPIAGARMNTERPRAGRIGHPHSTRAWKYMAADM